MNLKKIRAEFEILDKIVYLNNAYVGPVPRRVLEAATRILAEKQFGGAFWEKWNANLPGTRKTIAGLIKASPEEIAVCGNTSEGLGIVANGLQYEPNSNVVVSDLEFPSGAFNIQLQAEKHDLELRVVENKNGELNVEAFAEKIDRNTKLVLVSHVSFFNGFKVDLRAISKLCHENEAFLLTDAIQSVGALQVDVKQLGVDFLAGNGYKWLISPLATGFLYIRKELIEELEPSVVGYRSAGDMADLSSGEFQPARSASRFEHGQPNFPGYAGLTEAINFLESVGLANIEKRVLELTKLLIDGIVGLNEVWLETSPRMEHMSGIVRVGVDDPTKLHQQLQERNISVTNMLNGLRISPHFYNTSEEMELFLATIQELTE